MAGIEKNPQMIMWDPATYPDVETIADLGKTGVHRPLLRRRGVHGVLHPGAASCRPTRSTASYDGTPAQLRRRPGQGRPAGLRLGRAVHLRERGHGLGQAGRLRSTSTTPAGRTTPSRSPPSRRTSRRTPTASSKLVPIIQQSSVDYLTDPAETNELILDAVADVRQRLGLHPGRRRLRRRDDDRRRPHRQRPRRHDRQLRPRPRQRPDREGHPGLRRPSARHRRTA